MTWLYFVNIHTGYVLLEWKRASRGMGVPVDETFLFTFRWLYPYCTGWIQLSIYVKMPACEL